MKDIKSMIIGFLLATCMFLFIGATKNDRGRSQIGKYQATAYGNFAILINTETGEVYYPCQGGTCDWKDENRKIFHKK